MKKFILLITSIIYLIFCPLINAADPATPQSTCQTIYGGGETCTQSTSLTISKLIQNPQTFQYVNNLQSTDPAYYPNQTIKFNIIIKNVSNNQIKNIVIKDFYPKYLNCTSTRESICSDKKTASATINNLNKNESKTISFSGKVAPNDQLPKDQNTICLINQAIAVQNNQTSQTNTQFCIKKQIEITPKTKYPISNNYPVYPPSTSKITPKTGPEFLAFIGLIPTGALGFFLRKKANK